MGLEKDSIPEPPSQPTTEPPVLKPSKFERTMEFWRRNQIVLIHMPVILAATFGLYIFLKGFDSRIGIEGFGDLFGYALNAVRATLIISTSWWFKRWAWNDLRRRVEEDLFNQMRAGDHFAYVVLIKDRVEWVFCLCLFTYLFTR